MVPNPVVPGEDGDFNGDIGLSSTPEQVASDAAEDLHGASVFFKAENGGVFHTCSTYARGAGLLSGAFNWLDLAPKGRNEARTVDWVRPQRGLKRAPTHRGRTGR